MLNRRVCQSIIRSIRRKKQKMQHPPYRRVFREKGHGPRVFGPRSWSCGSSTRNVQYLILAGDSMFRREAGSRAGCGPRPVQLVELGSRSSQRSRSKSQASTRSPSSRVIVPTNRSMGLSPLHKHISHNTTLSEYQAVRFRVNPRHSGPREFPHWIA